MATHADGAAPAVATPKSPSLRAQLGHDDPHGFGASDTESTAGDSAPFTLPALACQGWVPAGGILIQNRLLKPRRRAQPPQLSRHDAHRVRSKHTVIPGDDEPLRPVYYRASKLNYTGFQVLKDGTCLATTRCSRTGNDTIHRFETQFLNFRESRRTPTSKQSLQDLVLVSLARDELPSYKFWEDGSTTKIEDPNKVQVKTTADIVDEAVAEMRYKKAVAHSLNHTSMKGLHNLPFVTPDDEAWEATYAYYTRVLHRFNQDPTTHKALMTIIDDNFTEVQKTLLLPYDQPGTDFDPILASNEIRYDAAFIKGGRFANVPKNLIAKFTMLHFGLPVAPMQLNEVIWASATVPDVDESTGLVKIDKNGVGKTKPIWKPCENVWPDKEINLEDFSYMTQFGHKPLEFLETYHERFHGYPGLRIKRRDSKAPPPVMVRPELTEARRIALESTRTCGTGRMVPQQLAAHTHHHNHHHQHGHHQHHQDHRKRMMRLRGSGCEDVIEDGDILRDQYVPTLRGGAGAMYDTDEDMDQEPLSDERSLSYVINDPEDSTFVYGEEDDDGGFEMVEPEDDYEQDDYEAIDDSNGRSGSPSSASTSINPATNAFDALGAVASAGTGIPARGHHHHHAHAPARRQPPTARKSATTTDRSQPESAGLMATIPPSIYGPMILPDEPLDDRRPTGKRRAHHDHHAGHDHHDRPGKRPRENPRPVIPDDENAIAWAKYIADNAKQDQLRIDAYLKHDSVSRGKAEEGPSVPRFGQVLEDKIRVGNNFPTIFTNVTTASQAHALKEALRRAQNIALKRTIPCGICKYEVGVTHDFEAQVIKHHQEHIDHIAKLEAKAANARYGSSGGLMNYDCVACTICSEEIRAVQYDVQGAPHNTAALAHLNHHMEVDARHEIFCENCGISLAPFQSLQCNINHARSCDAEHPPALGKPRFCEECGASFVCLVGGPGNLASHQNGCPNADRPQKVRYCGVQGCATHLSCRVTFPDALSLLHHMEDHKPADEIIVRDKVFKRICPHPGCNEDLSKLCDGGTKAHMDTHKVATCPFSGCQFDLNSKFDGGRAAHVAGHVDPNAILCDHPGCLVGIGEMSEQEKNDHTASHLVAICPYPECGFDLNSKCDGGRAAHVAEHANPNKIICPRNGCNKDVSSLSEKGRQDHIASHPEAKCAFPGCDFDLNFVCEFGRANHSAEHEKPVISTKRKICPHHGCCHDVTKLSPAEFQNHLDSHPKALCPITGCGFDLNTVCDQGRHNHLATHIADGSASTTTRTGVEPDFICPGEGCHRNLSDIRNFPTTKDLLEHIGTHLGLDGIGNNCAHSDSPGFYCGADFANWVEFPTHASILAHIAGHVKGKDKSKTTVLCPYGCKVDLKKIGGDVDDPNVVEDRTDLIHHLNVHARGLNPRSSTAPQAVVALPSVEQPEKSPKLTTEYKNHVRAHAGAGTEGNSFYCPACLNKVENAPLKAHRSGGSKGCNVDGASEANEGWLFLSKQEAEERRPDTDDEDESAGEMPVAEPRRRTPAARTASTKASAPPVTGISDFRKSPVKKPPRTTK